MKFVTRAVTAALFLAGSAVMAAAQTAAPAASFDDLVGHKLTAIDGSSIALNPAEGGMAREIISASGAIQRTWFAFINDRLGTVADAADIHRITGVFRRIDGGVEVEYANGGTEKLTLNPGGGLTLQAGMAGVTTCMSWYSEGHVFSLEERKAALAAFAARLGLADAATTAPKQDCGTAAVVVPAAGAPAVTGPAVAKPAAELVPAEPPKPAPPGRGARNARGKPPVPVIAPVPVTPAVAPAPAVTATLAAEAQAIEVRNSEVHTIDPAPTADAQPQLLASATPPNALAPDQHGASTCLSVESDGSHWGFRNHCGYTVQFAYCLMDNNPLASCRDGAVAGSVSGNGFGALVADESLKEADARHQFRWVACQGGAGEVIPHLDQVDPPSGRCVR